MNKSDKIISLLRQHADGYLQYLGYSITYIPMYTKQ